MLELKLVKIISVIYPCNTFNRTMLELKYMKFTDCVIRTLAFNRTMLELKCRPTPLFLLGRCPLIAPCWN